MSHIYLTYTCNIYNYYTLYHHIVHIITVTSGDTILIFRLAKKTKVGMVFLHDTVAHNLVKHIPKLQK